MFSQVQFERHDKQDIFSLWIYLHHSFISLALLKTPLSVLLFTVKYSHHISLFLLYSLLIASSWFYSPFSPFLYCLPFLVHLILLYDRIFHVDGRPNTGGLWHMSLTHLLAHLSIFCLTWLLSHGSAWRSRLSACPSLSAWLFFISSLLLAP